MLLCFNLNGYRDEAWCWFTLFKEAAWPGGLTGDYMHANPWILVIANAWVKWPLSKDSA